ncbi:MAG: signal peptidase I [Candidatus Phytoplasma vitis]|nr:MAG: signal peptidase I [Candidatus Phytoplasma vitis]
MFRNTNYYFLRSVVFIINLILNIFGLFLFVALICCIYFGPEIAPEKVLDIFGISCYQCLGGSSMEPTIKTDDIVVVKKISDKQKEKLKAGYYTGDIVVFKNKELYEGIPIIHRVIKNNISSKTIETQGDNKLLPDCRLKIFSLSNNISNIPTKYDDILAKHMFTISDFKTFLFFFSLMSIFSNCMPSLLKNKFLSEKNKNNLYK